MRDNPIVDVIIPAYKPKESFISNRLQSTNIQLWREQLRTVLGKGNPALMKVLKDFRQYLKNPLCQ